MAKEADVTVKLLVTLDAKAEARAVIERVIGDAAQVTYLSDVSPESRAQALNAAQVVIARNTAHELKQGEAALLGNLRLIQFVTAGVDYIPLADLPAHIPIACNGGAYAEPMAEHAVAMAFAAAKRLLVEHKKLEQGTFDQFRLNRMLRGAVCGILGYGGIGAEVARVMKALGLKVHAINRRGTAAQGVDWIGTPERLDELLSASDVLIITVPLTKATERMIGAHELGVMKRDAILINLARGEIVDERAFYQHLKVTPTFTACIDAWWIEPVRHGMFRMDHPFLELPNVIASPHNSASAAGWRDVALTRAVENARRACLGETPWHIVPPSDRMM